MNQVKGALLPEFMITFNRFSEEEGQKSDRIIEQCQELVDEISKLGVDFRYGFLRGKAGFKQKTFPIGIFIKLKNQEDRETVINLLSNLDGISWNEVLPELTEKGRRIVDGR